jgi:hypothetical protein
MKYKMNDLYIIGGGISGIYASLQLGGIVLEKNSILGGRIKYDTWRGHHVRMGGGVFRTNDSILQRLLHEYQVPYHFESNPLFYTLPHVDVIQTLTKLRHIYKTQPPLSHTTFREFAMKHLGAEEYQRFLHTTLYNDYENDSSESVLDDPTEFTFMINGTYGYANLDELIQKMAKRIQYQTNTEVNELIDCTTHWLIKAMVNDIPVIYRSKKIILATTVSSVKKLFPFSMINLIHPSPTLRMYGEFRSQDIPLLQQVIKGHTLVKFPLHQIIPIEPSKGVYMIAYCDEEYAEQIHSLDKNVMFETDTVQHRNILSRMVESALSLPKYSLELQSIHGKYWKEAVHYIDKHVGLSVREEFIKQIQHPHPFLRIVGEITSEDNGWIEAALKSVDDIDWVKKKENNEDENDENNDKKNEEKNED